MLQKWGFLLIFTVKFRTIRFVELFVVISVKSYERNQIYYGCHRRLMTSPVKFYYACKRLGICKIIIASFLQLLKISWMRTMPMVDAPQQPCVEPTWKLCLGFHAGICIPLTFDYHWKVFIVGFWYKFWGLFVVNTRSSEGAIPGPTFYILDCRMKQIVY